MLLPEPVRVEVARWNPGQAKDRKEWGPNQMGQVCFQKHLARVEESRLVVDSYYSEW